jgi:hypothetical protein
MSGRDAEMLRRIARSGDCVMVKWLAAGVAVANIIGAILAARITVAHHNASLAAWLFVAGILTASASAIAFDQMFRFIEGGPHLEASRYWAHVEFGGERDAAREADLQAKFSRENRRFLVPALTGLASALLFVAGSILLVLR